jgi:hypothetical protein
MAGDEELLVDDKDVFAAALSDTPPAEPEQPSEEPKPEGDRPRDEQGRFVPKAADVETPAPVTGEKPPPEGALSSAEEKPAPEDAIPSWRLREVSQARRAEAEARQAAEERSRVLEAQLAYVMRQARQQQQPEKLPDLIEQPEEYARAIEQRLFQQFEQRDIARSLHRADRQYGEEFRQAYEAFNAPQYANDEHLLARVRNSYDQGEAILAWYREQKTLREIGPDPAAYRQKLEAEAEAKLLNDPAFRKKAMDQWRTDATSRPSSVTSLPNLARAPGSAGSSRDDWPTTDAGIFDTVAAGMNRR